MSDEALKKVVQDMPPVSPDVNNIKHDDLNNNNDDEGLNKENGPKDKFGRSFDPEIHQSKNGKPVISKLTGYINLRRGRASDSKEARKEFETKQTNVKYQAELSASLFINAGVSVFGETWYPVKNDHEDERKDLVLLFDNWFDSLGIDDLPPGWALAIGLSGYGLKRMQYEQNRSTAVKFMDKISIGFKVAIEKMKLFFKRKGKKSNVSQSDLRNDGVRQDDSSQRNS